MVHKVLHVNDSASVDKYNSHVKNGDTMVLYYSDWCGHCQMMKPEWEKFEERIHLKSKQEGGAWCPQHGINCPYRESCPYRRNRMDNIGYGYHHGPRNMMVARVNSDYLDMVDGHKEIAGYPTIYHLRDGKKVSEYSGPRSLEHFEKFLESIEKKTKSKSSKSKKAKSVQSKSRKKSSKKMSGGRRKSQRKNHKYNKRTKTQRNKRR